MPRFVALLRGVNVGKAKRVPMAELRAVLEGLGHEDVATLLNSGNAVFRAGRGSAGTHAAAIATALQAQFGFEVPVIVKSAAQFDAIIAANVLAGADVDAARLLVVFLQDESGLPALSTIASLARPPERFEIGVHAAYLYCANGILESKAGEALLGKAGKSVTTRNWGTTLKLQALLARS